MGNHLKLATPNDAQKKLFVYIAITLLSTMATKFAELTPEALSAMYWPQWVVFVIAIILPCFITWRAFIDKTQSRVDQMEYEKENGKG